MVGEFKNVLYYEKDIPFKPQFIGKCQHMNDERQDFLQISYLRPLYEALMEWCNRSHTINSSNLVIGSSFFYTQGQPSSFQILFLFEAFFTLLVSKGLNCIQIEKLGWYSVEI
jgi:hypothetical protein